MYDLSRRAFLATAAQTTLAISLSAQPCCGSITPAGRRLAGALDAMHVESLWLAHQHIRWETGEPDRGPDYHGPNTHTHCSAFAAAASKRLGVYLLRPPEHGQELLTNAQAEWLPGPDGRRAGWRPIPGGMRAMREAQHLANEGQLVVAIFASPDPHKPGHIAIVRPSEKPEHALEENGPDIIQAGQRNYTRTIARVGFEHHPGAWPDGIRYYAHTIQEKDFPYYPYS